MNDVVLTLIIGLLAQFIYRNGRTALIKFVKFIKSKWSIANTKMKDSHLEDELTFDSLELENNLLDDSIENTDNDLASN